MVRTRRPAERATNAELEPHKVDNTLAFMFETRFAMRLTRYAIEICRTAAGLFRGLAGTAEEFHRISEAA